MPYIVARRSHLFFALAAAGAIALPAHADPSPQDRATAKSEWTKGKQQMAVKAFDAAAKLFAHADELDPKAQYELDLARADIELLKLTEAATLLEKVKASSEAGADRERAAAASTLDKLTPRIPTVKLLPDGCSADEVTATIDGHTVKLDESTRLNPGQYIAKFTSDQCTAENKTFSLAEGESYDLHVRFTKQSGSAQPPDEAEPKRTGGTMAPAVVSFVVGGAGLVLGTVFGVLAFDTTNDLIPVCKNNVCPGKYIDNVAAAQAYGNASTAMFVIGGVGTALGVVLAVTVGRGSAPDPKSEKKDAATIYPSIIVGPNGLRGASVSGTF